jgi:ureidoacrylate peracid hydrolase
LGKVRWDIDPGRTSLLVVDLQNAFLLPESPLAAPDGLGILPTFNRLIAAARRIGVPVIFTATVHDPSEPPSRMDDLFPGRRIAKGLEASTRAQQIHADVERREGDLLVLKPRYSAFWQTELDATLRRMQVDTLIIGGVWSNVCVASTARDALFREYKVICVADCTAAGALPDTGLGFVGADDAQRTTLADIAWHIGEVAYADDVVARLSLRAPENA